MDSGNVCNLGVKKNFGPIISDPKKPFSDSKELSRKIKIIFEVF